MYLNNAVVARLLGVVSGGVVALKTTHWAKGEVVKGGLAAVYRSVSFSTN